MMKGIDEMTPSKKIKKTLTQSLLAATLLSGLAAGSASQSTIAHAQDNSALTEFENTVISVAEQASKAVVSIGNYQQRLDPYESWYSYSRGIDLSSMDREPVMVGHGSGVVYKIEGDLAYIVTNNHVIDGAESLEVIMPDGQTTEAELIGTDQITDLSVLTIPAEYVSDVMEFADSDAIQVGSIAIAIGSPLATEFASSVTQGIVSGVNRLVPVDTDGDGNDDFETSLLQTDAAINPGNSGGALVNSSGQLIGINQIKYSSTGVEGMGFAIPSNDVRHVIDQIEEHGEVMRPLLGVSTSNLYQISQESRVDVLGLEADRVDGAVVMEVVRNSPADKAGIQIYDVITAIDDKAVTNTQDLRSNLYRYTIGDEISVTLIREGSEQQVTVVLDQNVNSYNR